MSNIILTEESAATFRPMAALVVYKNENNASFLELHRIRRDGSMAEGRAVSMKFIQDMLEGFSSEYRTVPHGSVPANMLYCDTRSGKETYIWYNPPMKRQRFFADSLGLEDGVYHVPGTLYAVKGGVLYVFCFEGRKPKMESKALGVPYFNIYSDGSVCMGTAHPKIPDTVRLSYEDVMKAWEDAFWGSRDVHTNGSPSTRGNLIETIKKYKDVAFDTKDLTPRKESVETIIRNLTR